MYVIHDDEIHVGGSLGNVTGELKTSAVKSSATKHPSTVCLAVV